MPRYTCAESTLTISTGNSPARRSASAVLPVQVGPMSSTASGVRETGTLIGRA